MTNDKSAQILECAWQKGSNAVYCMLFRNKLSIELSWDGKKRKRRQDTTKKEYRQKSPEVSIIC